MAIRYLRAIIAAGALLLPFAASPTLAQTTPCAGEVLPTSFGQLCSIQSDLPALTEQDYGAVRLHFRPPPSLNDVIPERELRGTWLQALVRRTAAQSVRSAVVLLEVRALGPGLPLVRDEGGQDVGVPLAMLPLSIYRYDSRGGLGFSEVQSFADRVIGPRLLIRRDLLIRARVRVAFSKEDPSSLVGTLAPLVSAAAAFGAQGFLVDAYASQALVQSAQNIETTLRSADDVDGASDNWVDLSFERANRLEYAFQLNPRARQGQQQQRPQGLLTLTLERRPSLFTDDLLPGGQPGRRLPDYHTEGRLDSIAIGRIWSNGPSSIVRQDPALAGLVTILHNANVPEAQFDTLCRQLRLKLDEFGLSMHDTTAVAWAAFVSGESAQRREIQDLNCVRRDRDLWARYGFALPPTSPPPPPIPTRAVLDEWLDTTVRLALLEQDPAARFRRGRRLFGGQVLTNIASGTLFAAGEEPAANSYLDGDSVTRALRPLRVGCRFVRQTTDASPNLPRFSVLARRPDNNQLLTLTIDYAGRVGGGVEIVGLTVTSTDDADFAALAQTANVDSRCLDRETAPAQ
jgi:hypothetical protein